MLLSVEVFYNNYDLPALWRSPFLKRSVYCTDINTGITVYTACMIYSCGWLAAHDIQCFNMKGC